MKNRICYQRVSLIFLVSIYYICISTLYAQSEFFLKGNASNLGGGCFRITPDAGNQAGMATNLYPLDLATTFSISFTMNFGSKDGTGADGMTFVIGTDCNPSLGTGAAIGVSSSSNPSIIVEFDTYRNTGGGVDDIADDHIGLYKNGAVSATANQLNGAPVAAAGAGVNIEDGNYHTIVIQWTYNNATSQTISVLFDGVTRKTATGNYLAGLFGGTNLNYWSITGSTGGSSNNQSFCYTTPNTKTSCAGKSISFGAPIRGTNYSWTSNPVTNPINGQGSDSIQVNPLVNTVYTCNFIDACGNNRSLQFNANISPIPTATISGSSTICTNGAAQKIIFTASGATPPYTFTYTYNGGTNQTISSLTGKDTVSIPISTSTVASYTYALVSVKESSSLTCDQNQTGIAIVNVRQPSQATVVATAKRVCQNSASPDIVFTGSLGIAPYIFTYSTNIPIGGVTTHTVTSTGTGSTISVSVPTNTADTIIYTLTNVKDASGAACGASSSSDSVIIDPLPMSTITASANVCLNGPATEVLFTGYGVQPPVTFSYYKQVLGFDLSPIAQTPVTSVAPALTYTLLVPANSIGTTIFTNGISSSNVCTGNQGNGSATIVVNPIPTASISLTGASTVCQAGGSSQITFTGAAGTPPFTFSYNIDGGATLTINSLSGQNSVTLALTSMSVGTHTVNLLAVKDTFNCNQAQSGSVSIVVDPLPQATAGGSSSMCLNGTTSVSRANSFYGNINWTHNGNGTLTNPNSLTPTYNAGAGDAGKTITLTMTVTSTNACNPQTATATYLVNVDSLPLALVGGSKTICQNASGTVSGAIARYGAIQWASNGAGSLTNSNSLTPTYTAAAGDAGSVITLTMTVTSTNTCNPQTATAIYTFNVDKLPTATSPGSQTICENSTATISTATQTNGTPSWTENGVGSITNGANTLSPTYTANTNDKGNAILLTMTVTSTNTCNPQTAISTYTINVDPLPTAASPGSKTICENSTATINTATQTSGSPSWTTNGAGGLTNQNTLTPTYSATANDAGNTVTLTMTVTSTNACSGATATSLYTINVDHLPTATTTGSHTICENGSYTLQNGEAIQTYGTPSWTENGAGTLSNQNTLTPTYAAAATDKGNTVTLTMTVTSTSTCAGASKTATYLINVDPLPTASAGSTIPICAGTPNTVNNATATAGSVAWTMTGGSGTLTNGTSLTPTYTSAVGDAGNTITLTITVTSTNTCFPTSATAQYNIPVRPLLAATQSITNLVVCQNKPSDVVFKVTSQGGTPPYIFTYTENGITKTTTSNTTTTTISAATNNSGNTIYQLISVADVNCAQPLTVNSQTIIVNPLPQATISKDASVCRDSVAPKIIFAGTSSTGPYNFTFNMNGNSAASITSLGNDTAIISASTQTVGKFTYSLTSVTDANGCEQAQTGSATIVVNENPFASFTIDPEKTSVLESTLNISDASVNTQTWLWNFGDGSISPSPFPDPHTYADTGTYKIKLLVGSANGLCIDSTYQMVKIFLPTLIYIPNTFTPNGDGVNDIFKPEGDGILKFEMFIYDRWGNGIFYTDDIRKGWDGKANGGSDVAQIDTYLYVINLKALSNKHDYTYRGTVNLIK